MIKNTTIYRVIYGDTDKMGVVYYANYLRWFEIGRTELLRSLGITYKKLEDEGCFMPVSEVKCKYKSSCTYDDVLIIETALETPVKASFVFNYSILGEDKKKVFAEGYTRHACMNNDRKVIRPPEFLKNIIENSSLD